MTPAGVVILGCGFTGRRVASRLLERGARVTATTRTPAKLADLAARRASVLRVDSLDPATLDDLARSTPEGALVLYSVPPVEGASLLAALPNPARVVYLSATSVYGETRNVDEHTPAAPRTEREKLRFAAEQAAQGGPWSSLILRCAAIYGPGRGVHESVRRGTFRAPQEDRFVSRVHVGDLAALAEAALFSEMTGAYPVADEEPCPSMELARFTADLLGVSLLHDDAATRQADRRVDGRTIFKLLGVELRYPTFREGIHACLSARH